MLPFGLWSAPRFFTALVVAVEEVQQEGIKIDIHYLVDFFLVGGTALQECANALTPLFYIFDCLGIPIEKPEGSWPGLTFLGSQIDSDVLVIWAKLAEL